MLTREAIAYFSREVESLEGLNLPKDVSSAWMAHWRGDLVGALEIYATLNVSSLRRDLRALVEADRILLAVKRGEGFSRIVPSEIEEDPAARIVLEYARFSWAFWVDHSIAWRSLFSLFKMGLTLDRDMRSNRLRFDLLVMVLFLMGHLAAIRGNRLSGYLLASRMFSIYEGRVTHGKVFSAFFRNIIIAAYPYTLFVSGRLSKQMEAAVQLGEEMLPNDPYYLSVFTVSALYCYAYTGDTARAEIYSMKLSRQETIGGVLRYKPITKIMRLLPFALRGYGHLIEQDFNECLDSHLMSEADPLINSQFFRAAAIIALYQGKHSLATDCIAKARIERLKTRSFSAWEPFDTRLEQFAAGSSPFVPAQGAILGLPKVFELPPNLAALLIELIRSISDGMQSGRDWYVERVAHLLGHHLSWSNYEILPSVPSDNSLAPILRVGDRFVVYRAVPADRLPFFREMLSSINPVVMNIMTSYDEQLKAKELSSAAATGILAAQVSHDIRSPLASLNVIASTSKGLDNETRLQMQKVVGRIRDIANSLLSRNHVGKSQNDAPDCSSNGVLTLSEEETSIELLPTLVSYIASEKRLQYAHQKAIRIIDDTSAASFCFARIQKIEFGRILSNLLNNAIESFKEMGTVEISLREEAGVIKLSISDNGKGMTPDVLAKLGQRGFSFGKDGVESGSGLGVAHAMMALEAWGGSLCYESSVGLGTRAIMTLPLAESPSWFSVGLSVTSPGTVIVLDDDPIIHSIWSDKFAKMADVDVLHFYSAPEILTWYRETLGDVINPLYLCDYELTGSSSTGFDVIEMLGVADDSVMVTGRWDEPFVQGRAIKIGVKLLPKSRMDVIKVSVTPATIDERLFQSVDS